MQLTEFAFKLLLLFFPGIICAYIVDQLTVHRPRKLTWFLLQSFSFGAASYFLYWAGLKGLYHFCFKFYNYLVITFRIPIPVTFLKSLTDSKLAFSFREIAYVTIVSILLGGFLSWIGMCQAFWDTPGLKLVYTGTDFSGI